MRNSYFYQGQEYEALDVKEEPKINGKQYLRLILRPLYEDNKNYLVISESIKKEKNHAKVRHEQRTGR